MPGTPYPKEQMHRIAYTKLSEGQIADKLGPVAASGPTSASPLSDVFAGKIDPHRHRQRPGTGLHVQPEQPPFAG